MRVVMYLQQAYNYKNNYCLNNNNIGCGVVVNEHLVRVAIHEFTTYNKTTLIMELPKIEPIDWMKPEPIRPEVKEPLASTTHVHHIPLAARENIRRDYIGADGLLHIYYPGIPESY